jgi:hypothetical protein
MRPVISMVCDGLMSLASRMGTERDKAASVFYASQLITDEQILSAYRGAWMPRKIVDIPAQDACRKWRSWQAAGDQIEAVEAEERRLNLRSKVLDACRRARLFGGAAIFIGIGDEDLSRPLDAARVGRQGLRHLSVLDCRQLAAGEIERDPASEWYGAPGLYRLTGASGSAVDIHPSRLAIFHGTLSPGGDVGDARGNGWGESVLTAVLDAVKHADSTAANIASLVFEAKIDIIKVPQFSANIGNQAYQDAVLRRYALANTIKGVNGTLILDAEEDYQTKSAPLAGLTDILMAFLQIVSGAADIPVTRLLGQSPSGMNATGESDMKNYHDRIQAMQELEFSPALAHLDECLIRSATGNRDAAIHASWVPLEQMSEAQKADILKTKADAARALFGTMPGQEIIARPALSEAVANTLVEDGSLPGLEAAIEAHGALPGVRPSGVPPVEDATGPL